MYYKDLHRKNRGNNTADYDLPVTHKSYKKFLFPHFLFERCCEYNDGDRFNAGLTSLHFNKYKKTQKSLASI